MPVHYRIHIADGENVDVHAEKMDFGIRKLWFADQQDNIIAAFRWKSIQGFTVIDSADGQIIVDDLLEKRKQQSTEKANGPVLTALLRVQSNLTALGDVASSAWLRVREAKQEPSGLELLLSTRTADLERAYVQVTDYAKKLEPKMKLLSEEMKTLLETRRSDL